MAQEADMATKTKAPKFDATRPFYASVGAGDLVAGFALTTAGDVQARFAKLDLEPKALRDQAVTLVTARVEELQADAKKAQSAVEARITELQGDAKDLPVRAQKLVNEYLAELNKTVAELNKSYAELATRGQDFVAKVRRQESTQQAKAAAKTTAKKSAKSATKKTASPAKATKTAAQETAAKTSEAAGDAAGKAGA
jgi:uncharacterized coiled-coil protein SlyX